MRGVFRFSIFCAFLLSLSSLGYARHYPIVDSTTGRNLSMIVQVSIHPAINGQLLHRGDEIGLFDTNGLFFGFCRWDSLKNINVRAFGDNDFLAGKQGFYANDPIRIRIWDTSAQREYEAIATVLGGGSLKIYRQCDHHPLRPDRIDPPGGARAVRAGERGNGPVRVRPGQLVGNRSGRLLHPAGGDRVNLCGGGL